MLKTISPTIISVPRIHNSQLHYAIEFANKLDVELYKEEFQELLDEYPESAEIRFAYLDDLLLNGLEEEGAKPVSVQIRELIAEKPNNLRGKILGYYSKMEEDPDIDMTSHFENEFAKEIAALLHDKPYPVVVKDATFIWMIKLMMVYCTETKNEAGIEKLFLMIRNKQWSNTLTDLSFMAVGEVVMQDDIDDELIEILEWYSRLIKSELWPEPDPAPHYDIFYQILNRPIKDFTDEDIAEVLSIHDREKLSHDICWLLDQGCLRIVQLEGECNCDFILQATYLISYFKVRELASLVTRIMTGAPDIIFDQIVGDFSGENLLPWVYSLGAMNLEGWWDMLTYRDEDEEADMDTYWHSKSTWLNALVKISSHPWPQSKHAKELVEKLWTDYQKSNHECLGWLMYYIVSYGLDTYDARIKEAYANDLIEQDVHGTFEEAMSDKDEDVGLFAESHTPETIGDNYQEIIKYVRELEIEYQASSADTVAEEMARIRKDAADNSDFDEFIDTYDERDSDGKLSAMELAILETLIQDDNSYAPQSTASIIPIQRDGPKVGRNDPCPCGSGKKYKKCCL